MVRFLRNDRQPLAISNGTGKKLQQRFKSAAEQMPFSVPRHANIG